MLQEVPMTVALEHADGQKEISRRGATDRGKVRVVGGGVDGHIFTVTVGCD